LKNFSSKYILKWICCTVMRRVCRDEKVSTRYLEDTYYPATLVYTALALCIHPCLDFLVNRNGYPSALPLCSCGVRRINRDAVYLFNDSTSHQSLTNNCTSLFSTTVLCQNVESLYLAHHHRLYTAHIYNAHAMYITCRLINSAIAQEK
jgi:hypothetical protein